MKKLMDIISNWNKGKKAHDDRVKFSSEYIDAELFQAIHDRQRRDREKIRDIIRIEPILESIKTYRLAEDKELEAKHWQILAEYAQDQVNALTTVKSDVLPTGANNGKFDPQKDQYLTVWACNCTAKPEISESVIERAEKRHGYGIQP